MSRVSLMIAVATCIMSASARAADIESLAACTTRVFSDIHTKQEWTGKAPSGCFAHVAVYRRAEGLSVSAWTMERSAEGSIKLSFTATETIAEIQDAKKLAAANRDILARGKKLARCLEGTDPEEDSACRVRGRRDVVVEEESGVRDYKEIRLGDNGRDMVVHYVVADTVSTPTLPAEVPDEEPLPPGTELKVFTVR